MCVAIAKIKGADCPSLETLEACWSANPDGAGFSFNTDSKAVFIRKGFMTFDSFYKAFIYCDEKYNLKNRGVLIHFRIATHGATDKTMTHPFPVTNNVNKLKQGVVISSYAVAHNGIISLCSKESGELSDTALFIKDYMTPIAKSSSWFYDKNKMEKIISLARSKIAILNGKGEIQLLGGFEEQEKGVYYSNNFFKYYKGFCNNYGWDYDDYLYYYD